MKKVEWKNHVKGTMIVPMSLLILLVPFSLLLTWNLLTLILFWFALIPIVTLYLPGKALKTKNHLFESLVGLMIFYGIMVFMIYDHHQSDYFQVMMISCLINLIVVGTVTFLRRTNLLAK